MMISFWVFFNAEKAALGQIFGVAIVFFGEYVDLMIRVRIYY